jgi:MerR family transcriptional regulator/heat shock protein HspR
MEEFDENTPMFVISVAAELAVMHPQTLRQYDRMGLVVPTRTGGGGDAVADAGQVGVASDLI